MNKTKVLVCLLIVSPLAGPDRMPVRRSGPRNPERIALQMELRRCAGLFRSPRLDEALACFESGRRRALHAGHPDLASRFLSNSAAYYLARREYPTAIKLFYQARELARISGDQSTTGVAEANISSVFEQMGEVAKAAEWASRAIGKIEIKHRAKVLIQLGTLRARQGRTHEAAHLFREGIENADAAADWATYALGCDRLGEACYDAGRLAEAEHAMLEAWRVRKLQRLPALENSYRNLGRVRLARGDAASAAVLLERALESRPSGFQSAWDLYHTRGRVRLAQGRRSEALADFRAAVGLVRHWRTRVIPADATRLSSEQLLHEAFSGLVRAAALLYLETGRQSLAREAFAASEENRAASLRALLASPPVPDVVERTRRALGAGRAYIGFHLDEPDSWRWILDRRGLSLRRLPGRARIAAQMARFRQDLRGEDLYRTLFEGAEHCPRTWLLALDEDLFSAPLAALVASRRGGRDVRLVEERAIQIVSSAGLLAAASGAWNEVLNGPFAAVGDPVYNLADERWTGPRPRRRWPAFTAQAAGSLPHLPRLVASGREIELCAAEWSDRPPILLKGAGASRRGLRAAIDRRPAVLHLATHVVASRAARQGLIALSLSQNGAVELLHPSEIQTWGLDAGLVTLSGCSSGVAAALPGSGLLGLTRAWLAAGAASVAASLWPTPDDHGSLFRSLYRHLRRNPRAGPAAALRLAQLDMLAAPDRRSDPRYWGAYFVVANR